MPFIVDLFQFPKRLKKLKKYQVNCYLLVLKSMNFISPRRSIRIGGKNPKINEKNGAKRRKFTLIRVRKTPKNENISSLSKNQGIR